MTEPTGDDVPDGPSASGRPVGVAVVDDDDISRAGLTSLLEAHPDIEVVASRSHDEALATEAWDGVDVAIVDAADARRSDDQFPGVAVITHIRRCVPDPPALLVLTGHFFDDAVRRRMREAKADYFYHRTELQAVDDLYRAVLDPPAPTGTPPESDPEATFRVGVARSSRVNDAVAYAQDVQLIERLAARGTDRSRAWQAVRRSFNDIARLHTVNTDGTVPDRNQVDPSLSQIGRFLHWATRTKDVPPPTAP